MTIFTKLGLLCGCMLALLSLPQHLSAQAKIETKKVGFQHPELEKSFASYQIFEIDAQSLHDLAKNSTRFEFNLEFEAENKWSLQLDYHDIRAAHYREVAITPQGNKELPRRPNITYRGSQGAEHEPARFTITPDYMIGMVQQAGATYFLEPLQPMIATAPGNYYVLYNAEDVLVDPSLECSYTAGKKYALPPPEEEHKPTGSEKMPACTEVDLATGGDILMFNRYGTVMAVNDFILNVTNLMEPLYDDFNLSYLIVDQFVVTDAGSNPWTTSNDAFTILDDFAAWAGPNFATHDIGQIWTANDIQGCGDGPGNFTLIGCARAIGDVCGDQRYNVCEDFSNSSNCLRALSAHEIGHLFDGVHGQANNSTIMWGNIVCGATTWTAGNITRIQNHIDSRNCLSACGDCNISLLVLISRESCPGSFDGTITAIASGNAGLVTYSITGNINDSNTTGLFENLPPGDYTVRAQDDGGGLNCFIDVIVTVDDSPDTAPPASTCADFSQSYEFCPRVIDPNIGVGPWFTLGGDLSFTSTVAGSFPQLVDLSSGCVSDLFTSLEDIELRLQDSYEEGVCPKTIVNEYIMRDECDNISTDRVIVRHVFSESVAPVWDFSCQIDAVFTTEDGNVCPADATISLTEGQEITIDDGWVVGGIPIQSLNGCIEDECTLEDNLVIRVDDITVTGDDCSRTITVTFLAIDECDNISLPFVCNYTFVDNTAPVVNYLGLADGTTLTVECDLSDPNWDPFVPTADLTIFDNCAAFGSLDIQMEDELVEEGICGVSDFKSIWRCTWTVTDPCGNFTEYTLFTRIVDTQGPDWTFFPPDVGIECDQELPFQQATAKDDCSEVEVSWVDTRIDGDCPYNYTIRRRWTAEDGCGNTTVDDQLIEVSDTTPPDILLIDGYVNAYEDGQSIYTDCSEYVNIIKLRYATRAYDNCSGERPTSFEYEDFGLFDCAEYGYIGYLTTSWTATDECGNTATTTLHWFLVDETPPTFQGIPEDACLNSLPPVPQVQAIDDCEFATVEFNQSDPIDCDGGQYVERTWTATDVCGNSATATQRINLSNNGAPTVNVNYPGLAGLPSGSTAQLTADCSEDGSLLVPDLAAAVEIGAGCSANTAQISLQLFGNGDCNSNGYLARYRLRVSVQDVCDNVTNYELFIELVDQTGPELSGPEAITLSCGETIPEITATDACGEVANITFVDNPSLAVSCAANPQSFERTWTATDVCGNSSEFTQSIVILDTEGPVFSNVPADACGNSPIFIPVTAFDACSGMNIAVNFNENMSNEAGCGQVLTRTWTASDACGNTSVATQQVFFQDATAPSLSFAHPLLFGLSNDDELTLPIGLNLGNPLEIYDFGDNAIAIDDNCASNLVANLQVTNLGAGNCAISGILSRMRLTWTVTDPCGNSSKINLILMYEDNYGPDIFNVPADLVLYCDDPIPAPGEVFVKDDYDQEVVAIFNETYQNTAVGLRIIRSWTATDDCGNTTVEQQFIDIIDNTLECDFDLPETVFCNSDDNLIAIVVSGGTAPYTYSWEMTDCDGFLTSDPTNSSVLYTVGYTTQNFSVTVTDAVGCQRVCSISVVCEKPEVGSFFSLLDEVTELRVYPNPVDDLLQLKATSLIDRSATISVYNLYGQEMIRRAYAHWPADGLSLDTKVLPNGTYIVRLEAEGMDPVIREVVVLH